MMRAYYTLKNAGCYLNCKSQAIKKCVFIVHVARNSHLHHGYHFTGKLPHKQKEYDGQCELNKSSICLPGFLLIPFAMAAVRIIILIIITIFKCL